MKYENPKIPEGINVTSTHPLIDFSWMLLTVALVIGAFMVAISYTGGYFAQHVPFEMESVIADQYIDSMEFDSENKNSNVDNGEAVAYLQKLANELAKAQSLPEPMSITVHYIESEEINALATLGGHIIIFSGLVDELSSENALAMVLAHEIAHIKHRDPIVALGRGISMMLAVVALVGSTDSGMVEDIVGNIGSVTALSFSREQEEAADKEALNSLLNYYGHTLGADELFEILQGESELQPPLFLSSHPLTESRIVKIKTTQKDGVHLNGKNVVLTNLSAVLLTKDETTNAENSDNMGSIAIKENEESEYE